MVTSRMMGATEQHKLLPVAEETRNMVLTFHILGSANGGGKLACI
jgi:hypothetical protein